MWAASSAPDPWITAYASWGLTEASRRGLAVPTGAMNRALGALEPLLDRIHSSADSRTLERAAFALDVLAMAGRANAARMKALYAEREKASIETRALLLHAYALALPAEKNEIETLRREVEAAIHLEASNARVEFPGTRHEFGSDVITTAMVLRALIAVDPAHPLASKLARHLLEARAGGRYATTHDAAWALLALDAYRRTLPAPKDEFDARVFLGQRLVANARLGGETLRGKNLYIPMPELVKSAGSPLTFEVLGKGHLHYEAVLEVAREEQPKGPVESGFYITKTFRRVSELGAALGSAPKTNDVFLPGEVVVCEIEVVTPAPRSFVVVEDPLPGGLETLSLEHGQGGAGLDRYVEVRADR